MNRRSSTIAVLGLLLTGVAICLKQTFDLYGSLEPNVSSAILAAEVLLATVIIGSMVILVRRNLRKPVRLIRPTGRATFAPLRRLFAAVWS